MIEMRNPWNKRNNPTIKHNTAADARGFIYLMLGGNIATRQSAWSQKSTETSSDRARWRMDDRTASDQLQSGCGCLTARLQRRRPSVPAASGDSKASLWRSFQLTQTRDGGVRTCKMHVHVPTRSCLINWAANAPRHAQPRTATHPHPHLLPAPSVHAPSPGATTSAFRSLQQVDVAESGGGAF